MMKKKQMVMLMVALVLLVSCTPPQLIDEVKATDEPYYNDNTLVWNLGAEPGTLDPGLNIANVGGNVIINTFEGLVREVDGRLEPAVAESYKVSVDRLEYTFNLRETRWSDGEPVTAYDFEFAWKRVLAPETESGYKRLFEEGNIESFQALDDHTFHVKLKAPTPHFMDLMAFPVFYPVREDVVSSMSWSMTPEQFVCNGPFTLAEYRTSDRLILEKNQMYWRSELVKIDRIEALFVVDENTALEGYESGEIHVIDRIPRQAMQRLLAEEPTYMILPSDAVYYYVFNTEVTPLDDWRVRKALIMSIDRKAIVDTVTKGSEMPAMNMVSPASRDHHNQVFSEVAGDYAISLDSSSVDEARYLLEKAGYPDGEGFPTLTISYNTSENHAAIAQAVQEMWKQNLGIHVELENQEWAVFQDNLKKQRFEIARSGWISDYPDPMSFLALFMSSSPMNYGKWSNEQYDSLLQGSQTELGEKRYEALYQALDILMNDAATMPIYYYTDQILVSDQLQGWQYTSRGSWFFGFASLEKQLNTQ